MTKGQKCWAIIGKCGLYYGTWCYRLDATTHHAKSLGKTWNECRKSGDRAIKVYVIPVTESEAENET